MANRKRVSREVWTQRVERWRRSGQSMTAFASDIGVHPKTLSYWRWKLERESSKDVELHATT